MRLLLVPLSLLSLALPLRAQLVAHRQPRAGELVDSVAFAAFARARAGEASGNAVLSLVFDSAGSLKGARAIDGSLPAAVRSVLADSVVAYLRPQAGWSGGTWWVRLAVRSGPETTLRTGSCHEQPPVLRSTSDIGAILAAGGNAPRRLIDLRFLVSETGFVLRVEPGTSMPAVSPLDAARLIERLRYTPGFVDGEPQPMWVGVRVQSFGVRTR